MERGMDALDAILTRRSIRKYTGEPVPDELLDKLLHAAMNAPTAAGEAWHFVIIRDKEVLEGFTVFHPHAHMLRSASAGILVCGDPEAEALKGRWVLDCAAATENILIAANALGLGACWVGIYPVEERIKGARTLLGIPDHIVPLSMVSLGWPGEKKHPPNRYSAEKIHPARW
jgi:nitroreductase